MHAKTALKEASLIRVAFLATHGLINTGGNIYDMEVMRGLAEAGHQVELHTSGFEEVSLKQTGLIDVAPDVKVVFHRKPFQFYPKNTLLLNAARLYRGGKTIWDMTFSIKGKFDYVVFCEDLACSVFPLVSRHGSKSIAVIHHIGGQSFSDYLKGVLRGMNPYAFWMSRAGCSFLRQMDSIVTVSEHWKEKLQRDYGYKNVEVILNGIDPDFFEDHADLETFRRRYGLRGKFVLMTGVFGRGRGIETVLSAIEEMKNVKFIVTGRKWSDPVWEEKVTPATMRLEKKGKFTWTGVLPWEEYKAAMLSADAVLQISEYEEGWGRILHEGALAGKPLITTGLGGMRGIAEETESWTVEPGDSEGLKRVIEEIRGLSSEELDEVEKTNQKWAESHSWERTVEKWRALLET